LRSGRAHWDLELAVEVRQCPLGSGARGGGPAVPTGIWTARRRRRRRRTALIKSNNPHLAGGEKHEVFYKGLQKHQVTYRIMAILNPTLAAEPTQINYQIGHQYLMVNRDFPIGLLV